jgi:hypothetical protein
VLFYNLTYGFFFVVVNLFIFAIFLFLYYLKYRLDE